MKITILLVLPTTARSGEPAVFQWTSKSPDKPRATTRHDDGLSLGLDVARRPFRPGR